MPTTTLMTPTSIALPMPLPLLLAGGKGTAPAWARCFAALVMPEKKDGSLLSWALGCALGCGTACTEPAEKRAACDRHGCTRTGMHELAHKLGGLSGDGLALLHA